MKNSILDKSDIISIGKSMSNIHLNPIDDNKMYEKNSDVPINSLVYELYDNGNIKFYTDVENGLSNGKSIWLYDTGELKIEMQMINGQPHGSYKEYYKDGKIKLEKTFKYGWSISEIEYDECGKKINEIHEPDELTDAIIKKIELSNKEK